MTQQKHLLLCLMDQQNTTSVLPDSDLLSAVENAAFVDILASTFSSGTFHSSGTFFDEDIIGMPSTSTGSENWSNQDVHNSKGNIGAGAVGPWIPVADGLGFWENPCNSQEVMNSQQPLQPQQQQLQQPQQQQLQQHQQQQLQQPQQQQQLPQQQQLQPQHQLLQLQLPQHQQQQPLQHQQQQLLLSQQQQLLLSQQQQLQLPQHQQQLLQHQQQQLPPQHQLLQPQQMLLQLKSQQSQQTEMQQHHQQQQMQLQQQEQQELNFHPQDSGSFLTLPLPFVTTSNQLKLYNHPFKHPQITQAPFVFSKKSCFASLFAGEALVKYQPQSRVQHKPVADHHVTTEQDASTLTILSHSTAGPSHVINPGCDPYTEQPYSPDTQLSAALVAQECEALVVQECIATDPSSNNVAVKSSFDRNLGHPNTNVSKPIKEEILPPCDSLDVMHLNHWPGDLHFSIRLPAQLHTNPKWCYSEILKRLYCPPGVTFEVLVALKNWQAVEGGGAAVRLCAVYTDAHHRTSAVKRCCNHSKQDQTPNSDHIIQVDSSHAVYSSVGDRKVVTVPLHAPPPGVDHVKLLVKCTCMTSCIGGPNRRPFAVLFSCMMHGVEVGRHCLSIKCCKNYNRDKDADEDKLQRIEAKAIEDQRTRIPNAKEKSPAPSTSSGKKRKLEIKDQTSDGGPDFSCGTKSSSCGLSSLSTQLPAAICPPAPAGYVNVLVPQQYETRMTDYLRALIAHDLLKEKLPETYQRYLK